MGTTDEHLDDPLASTPPFGDRVEGEAFGPYTVQGYLAGGGTATVYAATDRRSGARVALKILRPFDEEARQRFRREFRALSRMQHPNVLRVFETGMYGARPWFSMELVEGRDLRDEVPTWVDLEPSVRFARAQAVLTQVARALDFIHDRGLVHRDVTPGNIRVRPDGVVKLMDFGVVREVGSDLTNVSDLGGIMGTAAWIAPEQIAGHDVDARADLYALGAVLYLMLTGRRPFHARTVQGWLEKHLHEVPRPPRELEPQVPAFLDGVCSRLLEKDPAKRYASASHLLHVLGEVDPLDDAEHWPPRLVGRTMVRARLRALVAQIEAGAGGGVLLVQGEPGQGKTRLMDTAEQQARRRGLRVARARARGTDGPFGLFSNLLRALSPPEVPPVLRSSLLGEGPASLERYPVHVAFKAVLAALQPIVLILDDLQDVDAASAELLEYLIRNALELSADPIVFVLGEDCEGDAPTAMQQRLPPSLTLRERLGPLALAEVEELVLSVLSEADGARALAERLFAETGGSPAWLADMLRGLVDEQILVREGDRWRITLDPNEITRSRLPMPASLKAALSERLAPLSRHALQVGRSLAVARRRLDLDLLAEVTDLDEERATEALDELVLAGIVQESLGQAGDCAELAHIRFREVLLDGLPDEERRHRHQRTGEALERHHRHRLGLVVEDLAYHFTEAGLPTKAYAYLIRTARRRLDASLWEEALEILDRALRLEPSARPQMLLEDADRTLAELRLGRAQCLQSLGRARESLEDARFAVDRAREVADAALESRALLELGRWTRQRGDVDEAAPWLDLALERAEASHDPGLRPAPLYELGALCWSRGDLPGAERNWRLSLEAAQKAADERGIAFGYNGLGILAFCQGQTVEARRHLELAAEMFERLGMLAPLSYARVNLAELYHASGLLKKAAALAEQTLATAREVHHPVGAALGLAHRARALAEIGRLDEARRDAEEAVELCASVQSPEDELTAWWVLLQIHLEAGDTAEALEALVRVDRLMPAYDHEGMATTVQGWRAAALARASRLAEARDVLAQAHAPARWPHVRVRADLALGTAWRLVGDPERAREPLQRALQAAEANGFRLYQLHAHEALCAVVDDAATRARHSRVASALARSLSSSLSKSDAQRFLARGWGAA